MTEYCARCGKKLNRLDVAATMKFINRGAVEYYCLDCIASHYDVPVSRLQKMIAYYRRQGCALFQ
jgi:hypothetical protein